MTPAIVAILECPGCRLRAERPLPLELHDNYHCRRCELGGSYDVFLQVVGFKEVCRC